MIMIIIITIFCVKGQSMQQTDFVSFLNLPQDKARYYKPSIREIRAFLTVT